MQLPPGAPDVYGFLPTKKMPSRGEYMAGMFKDIQLPAPPITQALPISGPAFPRPDPEIVRRLGAVGSATASAVMHRMGVRQTFVAGPQPRTPGKKVCGAIVTLQFMPRREDIIWNMGSGAAEEHLEKKTALWHVFEAVQPGDILAVQAWGDRYTGTMGEMLITYFKGRGGVGIVVDGCIRDAPSVLAMDVPLWTVGFTPNYASQGTLLPWAYNVPVAMSGVLAIPGDIMIADDDGVVVVPAAMAELVLKHTREHEDWEEFSRIRLSEGGSIRHYYPLDEVGQAEYEAWRKKHGK
jgi:regulator of RNase E activity RraA